MIVRDCGTYRWIDGVSWTGFWFAFSIDRNSCSERSGGEREKKEWSAVTLGVWGGGRGEGRGPRGVARNSTVPIQWRLTSGSAYGPGPYEGPVHNLGSGYHGPIKSIGV